MTSPKDYQIFQRDGSNQADIIISGTTAYSDSVEARWGDTGDWTTLNTNAGAFLDTLYNQNVGQRTLYVRGKINYCAIDTVDYVGVGDVFALYGQNNAVGQGINNQVWAHATLKAGNFKKDYQWHLLSDPVHDPTGIVDSVANVGAAGSIWPIIADSIMANYNIPVGFIPCAMGGYPINSLIPGVDSLDRTTMYGSMHNRVNTVYGTRAVLFWQGEADASLDRSQEYYNIRLDSLANSTYSDFSAKLMPVLLQNGDVSDVSEAKIRSAVVEAWTDNPNVLVGPDFSDLTTDDGAHIKIDAKIDSCANRFWRKIRDNIYEAP